MGETKMPDSGMLKSRTVVALLLFNCKKYFEIEINKSLSMNEYNYKVNSGVMSQNLAK